MILAAKIQVKELESKRGTTSLRRDHFFSEAACHRKLQLFGYHMTQNEVTADTKTSMEYTRSTVNILPPSLQKYPYQHDCPVTISTDTSAVRCSVNRAMDIRVIRYIPWSGTTNCNARCAIHFQTWMVVQPVATITHDMFFTGTKRKQSLPMLL